MRRFMRPMALGLVALLLLAVPAAAVIARSYILAPTAQPRPDQPIQFPHGLHVNVIGLDCLYCHRGAAMEANAGVPALELCMGCHAIVPHEGREELETLVMAFNAGTPINWNRIHQMPDHVHFVHNMHVQAGIDCATCHGDVAQMNLVRQVRDLRMGDCIECHRQENARTDCAVCHY